jgi:hypothetical protein
MRARCVEVYAVLARSEGAGGDIRGALEEVDELLADLVHDCGMNAAVARNLAETRSMVASHLLAVFDLEQVGSDPSRTVDLLRRAQQRAIRDVMTVIERIPAPMPGLPVAR